MPSGAKKRKAAKKKLQKVANNNGSHSQGVDGPKSHDERSIDGGGEVEREENFEGGGLNNDEVGAKEREENVAGETVQTDEVARELKNGDKKSSSSSSSSSGSSSDDDEVVVEKDKLVEAGLAKEQQDVEATVENPAVSEVVDKVVEESIPLEESVKQLVSLPQDSATVIESVPVENLSTSDAIESGLKQNVDEALHLLDEKSQVGSDVVQEKIEEKVIPVVIEGSENTSAPVGVTARDDDKDDEGLLPQSSGVKAVEECRLDDNGKESERHKYAEEEPLISGAPLPVRRTSWMNCCGLFEVFSGGSSR